MKANSFLIQGVYPRGSGAFFGGPKPKLAVVLICAVAGPIGAAALARKNFQLQSVVMTTLFDPFGNRPSRRIERPEKKRYDAQ